MTCPKCNKDTAVLVTTHATRTQQERLGLVLWIVFFPFFLIRWLFRAGFGRRETYYKKTNYKCNYCGHEFPASFKQPQESTPEL